MRQADGGSGEGDGLGGPALVNEAADVERAGPVEGARVGRMAGARLHRGVDLPGVLGGVRVPYGPVGEHTGSAASVRHVPRVPAAVYHR